MSLLQQERARLAWLSAWFVVELLLSLVAMAHLDPLPHELAQLASKQSLALSHDLATLDELIARLSRARDRLDPHSSPDDAHSLAESTVADELLQLSSYVKNTAYRDADKAHKEWSSAVSRLGKTVDKVRPRGVPLGICGLLHGHSVII